MTTARQIYMKFGTGDLYKKLSYVHEFRQNRPRDRHPLLTDVDEFLPVLFHISLLIRVTFSTEEL